MASASCLGKVDLLHIDFHFIIYYILFNKKIHILTLLRRVKGANGYLNFVVVFFHKASKSKSESFVRANRPIHARFKIYIKLKNLIED